MKKKKIKYDAEYIQYFESRESQAVLLVRDLTNEIVTIGKWIDIVEMDIFTGKTDYIIAELFNRKLEPEYFSDDTDINRYITWDTATKDIRQQREQGIRGSIYIIKCKLSEKWNPKRRIMELKYKIYNVRHKKRYYFK